MESNIDFIHEKKKKKIPIKILIKNLVGWNKLELAMTLRSYVGLPLNHLKGQAKEEEEKTTGLIMENISLKIINLFEILFLKLILFLFQNNWNQSYFL